MIRIVAERLLSERLRMGLTQQQMSELGGVKKRSYNYYESGERNPDSSFLAGVASAGADVGYILTGIRTIRRTGMEQLELDLFNSMVDTFWNLSDDNRAHVLKTAEALVNYEVRKHGGTRGIKKIDPPKTKGE